MVPAQPESSALSTDDTTLRDTLGRHVLLRGVNAGGTSKLPPFLPFDFSEAGVEDAPPFDEALATYVDRVAGWGHNVARVPFTWEAVEPTRGAYDDEFIGRYRALLEAFDARGIRVIVDFHQDVYTRAYCGDGFPLWAMSDPDADFRTDCGNWFTGYLGDSEIDAEYDRFWSDADGLHDAFESMWRYMVQQTRDIPGVIGYEIVNEPHGGTMDDHEFYTDVLEPFYDRIGGAIHEEDPDGLVFLDISGVDGQSGGTTFDPPEEPGFVFAPHYYSPAVFVLGPDAASYDVPEELTSLAEYAAEEKIPTLLGEFGTKTGTDGALPYYIDNFDALDRHLMSGTAWEYSDSDTDWNDENFRLYVRGEGERPAAQALVRPFPLAITGTLTGVEYTHGEPALSFDYLPTEAPETSINEVRVPATLAGTGEFTCTLDNVDVACAWHEASQTVVFRQPTDVDASREKTVNISW